MVLKHHESPCSITKIESKSWRSGGGLSGEIGLKRLRFRPRPSFETAVFAGSKSCPPRSSPVTAEPARSNGNHLIRVEPRKSWHLRPFKRFWRYFKNMLN